MKSTINKILLEQSSPPGNDWQKIARNQEQVYKDKGVQEVISNVNQLRNEIDLAKQGFLNKTQFESLV